MKAVTCRIPPPADLHLNGTAAMNQVASQNCFLQPRTHSHCSWFNLIIQNFINTKAVTKTRLLSMTLIWFFFLTCLQQVKERKSEKNGQPCCGRQASSWRKTKLKINKSLDCCQSDAPVTDTEHRCDNSKRTHLILSSKCQAGPRGSMYRRPSKPGVLYPKKVVWPTATARRGRMRGQPTVRPRTTELADEILTQKI